MQAGCILPKPRLGGRFCAWSESDGRTRTCHPVPYLYRLLLYRLGRRTYGAVDG